MEFPQIDKAYELINEKLQTWLEGGIKHLPNIVVALFIAIAFGLIAKVAGNILRKGLRRAFESRQIADQSVYRLCGYFHCA